jgi:hypothetical protein
VLRAVRTTRIQLTFLMAHEYAHALLHQAPPKSAAAEEEADRFAYDFMMSQPGEFDSGEVWLALRWFFRTAALDRIIGEMLYGGVVVDWDQDVLMHRSSMIFEYAARRPPERPLNSLESIGTVLLMASETDVITIELEIDAANAGATEIRPGILWEDGGHPGGVVIELVEAEAGHGFGISEMATIVVSISAGASSQLVADAIRAAVGRVIRTAKAKSAARSDGSREGLAKHRRQ